MDASERRGWLFEPLAYLHYIITECELAVNGGSWRGVGWGGLRFHGSRSTASDRGVIFTRGCKSPPYGQGNVATHTMS